MHAHCLELLADHLQPGAKVLDVGHGTGYLVAAMAKMVTPGGQVYGVEHIPELVELSRHNLQVRYYEQLAAVPSSMVPCRVVTASCAPMVAPDVA